MSVPLRSRQDTEAELPPPETTDPQPTVHVESTWSLER